MHNHQKNVETTKISGTEQATAEQEEKLKRHLNLMIFNMPESEETEREK